MKTLEQLRMLLNAASPAPFTVKSEWTNEHSGADVVYAADGQVVCQCDEHDGGYGGGHRNVEMLVALRNVAPALLDLAEAVKAWCAAECETQSLTTDDIERAGEDECVGGNHADACPVELARHDVIDASNKLEAL